MKLSVKETPKYIPQPGDIYTCSLSDDCIFLCLAAGPWPRDSESDVIHLIIVGSPSGHIGYWYNHREFKKLSPINGGAIFEPK